MTMKVDNERVRLGEDMEKKPRNTEDQIGGVDALPNEDGDIDNIANIDSCEARKEQVHGRMCL
jgi:hypothetical protein